MGDGDGRWKMEDQAARGWIVEVELAIRSLFPRFAFRVSRLSFLKLHMQLFDDDNFGQARTALSSNRRCALRGNKGLAKHCHVKRQEYHPQHHPHAECMEYD